MSRSVNLTTAVLRKKVAKKTGLPESIVGQVLDYALEENREELMQQGTVKLRGFASISTTMKTLGGNLIDHRGSRRIILTIRPLRSFRERLNRVSLD